MRSAAMEITTSYVGAALSPRETKKLVLGRGSYIGDVTMPSLLHAAFVRSPHAHARIRGIDVEAARRQPGIVAVLTGHDLARVTAPLRIAPPIDGLLPMEMPTLPVDKVRFVGDPVACVIGEQRYHVEDACALVDVAYDPLAAVVDPERAQDPGCPWSTRRSRPIARTRASSPAVMSRPPSALPTAWLRCASTRGARRTCRSNRAAAWRAGCPATRPSRSGTRLRSRIRCVGAGRASRHLGERGPGDHAGRRRWLRAEDPALSRGARDGRASRLLGRPVRWLETRRENLLASLHAREDIVDVRAAVKSDGAILGMDVQILTDFGAYAYFPANYMARVIGMMIPGAYRLRDYRYAITCSPDEQVPGGPVPSAHADLQLGDRGHDRRDRSSPGAGPDRGAAPKHARRL
jgi:carbon-monoxide dehydrogenase large subunit